MWNPKYQDTQGLVGTYRNEPKDLDKSYFIVGPKPNPPGIDLDNIFTQLKYINNLKPLRIVETGVIRNTDPKSEYSDGWSTLYTAQWVDRNQYDTPALAIDIDTWSIDVAKKCLHYLGLQHTFNFVCGDSLEVMIHWLGDKFDLAFLDSCDGLDHGLEEFKAAEKLGCKYIIMDDFDSKARKAVGYALLNNYRYQQIGRYSLLIK